MVLTYDMIHSNVGQDRGLGATWSKMISLLMDVVDATLTNDYLTGACEQFDFVDIANIGPYGAPDSPDFEYHGAQLIFRVMVFVN